MALVDSAGDLALVGRTWRESLLGGEDFEDHEYRWQGMHVLARKDIVDRAANLAVGEPYMLSVTTGET